ncbi:MAG: hypothetical protein V3U80_00660 [Flavobacteriaceae bacterium]
MPSKKQNAVKKTMSNPIDFTSIDAYPLLPECEQLGSREAQKKCFYLQLSSQIETSLKEVNFTFSETTQDTVQVKILISDQGKLSVSKLIAPNTNSKDLKTLERIIYNSIIQIPVVKPAIKSGIPVTTEFSLPLIISSK